MNIIGLEVEHAQLGLGKVIQQSDTQIIVQFANREMRFQYPQSFGRFLTARDDSAQNALMILIHEKQQQKSDEEAKAQAAEQLLARRQPRASKSRSKPNSNVAFKCTFCDGGSTNQKIGYSGVCCEAVMEYNVAVNKVVWCSHEDCACCKAYYGEISRDAIDSPCYESRMLLDWCAFAGYWHNGEKSGQPIRMNNVRSNSLAVLTTREPNTPEDERMIFAVFLVDEAYQGDEQEAGFVYADDTFRIALNADECKKMLFWNYHSNSEAPLNAKWGSGLYRYLSDEVSAQILRDVAKIKRNTDDEALANQLLELFCAQHDIDLSTLPEPNGALLRKEAATTA